MYDKKAYFQLIISLAILIFVVQLFMTGFNSITFFMILRKISTTTTISLLFHFLFKKWFWKFKIFRPLIVKVPNLNGVWEGKLESYWEDSNNESIPPIQIKVFIRQDFDSISIEMHSDKMISNSYTANIVTDKNTGAQELIYNYTSKSKIDNRETNPWHDGTTKLFIHDGGNIKLEGEYWTVRKTIGKIRLNRVSKNIR